MTPTARLAGPQSIRYYVSRSSQHGAVLSLSVETMSEVEALTTFLAGRYTIDAEVGATARNRFFLSPDGKVMSAMAQTGGIDVFSAPTTLFQSPNLNPRVLLDHWDVSRDGQRFLFSKRVDQDKGSDAARLTIVMNWQQLLPKQ